MIPPTATPTTSTQFDGAARDAGRSDPASGDGARFDLAIAAMFQPLGTEHAAEYLPHADDSRATRGESTASKDPRAKKDRGSTVQDTTPGVKGLDPHLAMQQPLLDAQQRLMRSADVAGRAAAELRGEMDQPSQTIDTEQASPGSDLAPRSIKAERDSSPASATSANGGGAASAHSNSTPSEPNSTPQPRSVASFDRLPAHSAPATSSQQNSGGSQQGHGDHRPQAHPMAAVQQPPRNFASGQRAANAAPAIGSTTGSAPSTGTQGAPGPGSLASLRDPLRPFSARPEAKATKTSAEPANLPNQVARGLAAAVRQRDGTLTLRLSPDSLGEIRIQVRVESGQVSAHIDAQSDQARQLLTESAATLRSALEAQGLVVERIEVAPAERHATPDPAVAHAPIAGERAQGGALSPPDQPSPHGFGDGASPEHREGHSAHSHQPSSDDAYTASDLAGEAIDSSNLPTPLEFNSGRWVMRVDLVA